MKLALTLAFAVLSAPLFGGPYLQGTILDSELAPGRNLAEEIHPGMRRSEVDRLLAPREAAPPITPFSLEGHLTLPNGLSIGIPVAPPPSIQPRFLHGFRSGALQWDVYAVTQRIEIAVPYRLRPSQNGKLQESPNDRVIGPAKTHYDDPDSKP